MRDSFLLEAEPLGHLFERGFFAVHKESDAEDFCGHPDEEEGKGKVYRIGEEKLPEGRVEGNADEHKHRAHERHEGSPEGEGTIGVLERVDGAVEGKHLEHADREGDLVGVFGVLIGGSDGGVDCGEGDVAADKKELPITLFLSSRYGNETIKEIKE